MGRNPPPPPREDELLSSSSSWLANCSDLFSLLLRFVVCSSPPLRGEIGLKEVEPEVLVGVAVATADIGKLEEVVIRGGITPITFPEDELQELCRDLVVRGGLLVLITF